MPPAIRPYDVATITPVRACRQFRITLETNRYSVPAEFAGRRLTLKAYPERLCIYHQDQLIARHIRTYDRRQDLLEIEIAPPDLSIYDRTPNSAPGGAP